MHYRTIAVIFLIWHFKKLFPQKYGPAKFTPTGKILRMRIKNKRSFSPLAGIWSPIFFMQLWANLGKARVFFRMAVFCWISCALFF